MSEPESPHARRQAETVEKQREAFLGFLRGSPECAPKSVSAAAIAAGVSRAAVYRWRNDDDEFAQAWDDAYETGTDTLEEEAIRRSTQGVRKVKFYKGQPLMIPHPDFPDDPSKAMPYIEHEYSDTLLMQQLNARRPEKYRTNHKVEHTGGVKIVISPDDDAL